MKSLSRVWLFATPWTAAHQAPPSMGFSRQECWSGVPLPSPHRHATSSQYQALEQAQDTAYFSFFTRQLGKAFLPWHYVILNHLPRLPATLVMRQKLMIPWSQEAVHGGSPQMRALWVRILMWILSTKLLHSQGFQVAEERESLAELGPWRSLGVEIEE